MGLVNIKAMTSHPSYKWYVLLLLVLIYIFGAVDRGVVAVITEPLKNEFDLSDSEIGILGGLAYSVPFALFVLPMGWLVDRVNRRVLLSATVTVWSMCTAVSAFAGNYYHLIAARMGVGVAEAPASPASLSLLADTFPVSLRSTAVGIYYAGAAVGQFLIFVVGGWILLNHGWREVFLVAGIPGLILAALLFFTTREPERGAMDRASGKAEIVKSNSDKTSMTSSLRDIFLDHPLRNALLANTFSTGVQYSLMVWLTSFLVRLHDLSVTEAALWVGVGIGVSQSLGSLVIGPIADRYTAGDPSKLARIPAIATFVTVFAGVLMALAPSLSWAVTGMVLVGLMAGFFVATGYSLILSLADPDVRGTTLATGKLISILVGGGLIPFLTGFVSDLVGGSDSLRPAILATVSLHLLASFLFFRAGFHAKKIRMSKI